jgi:hypothetical protein
MNYLNEHIDSTDISAETLIALMDTKENFDVVMRGIFSRNFSEDLISVRNEYDKTLVELSRDGIFQLLPEVLLFDEIKGVADHDVRAQHKHLKEKQEKMKSFFQFFDNEYFRLSLQQEKNANRIAEKGNIFLLTGMLDETEIDTGNNNEYIAKIKILLPFAGCLRGNFFLLTDILKNTLSVEKVETQKIQPLRMRFIFQKDGLSKDEYLRMNEEVTVFFDFFTQWFLPVEMEYDFRIKSYKTPFTLGNTLLLGYNTHLHKRI